MTTAAIFDKYASALVDIGADTLKLSTDAVLLALRLAVQDAYAAGAALADDLAASVASQAQITAERDRLRAQLEHAELELEGRRMCGAAWVDEIDRLREQLAAMDADNARLIASLTAADKIQETLNQAIADRDDQSDHLIRNAKNMTLLLEERDRTILRLQAEIDRLTRQNVIAVDTFNSLAAHTNGANPTPAAQSQDWGRSHPAWDGLSDDQRVTLYQLTKGELTFRQISRKERIDLVGRVLRHLADADGNVTSTQFDRLRPEWMSTAGAVVLLAESRKWNDLLTLVATKAAA